MARRTARRAAPSWDALFEVASGQEGLFTTVQAADAGYSPQLLQKHLHGGRIQRIRRGVYRLVHFPPGEHEDLAAVWLWSDRAGVFSHETALFLHGLSDVLPSRVHLTVPDPLRHGQTPTRRSLRKSATTSTWRTCERAWPGPTSHRR